MQKMPYKIFLSRPIQTLLWVLKGTVSIRRFFWALKTNIQIDGHEYRYSFIILKFPSLVLKRSLIYIQ